MRTHILTALLSVLFTLPLMSAHQATAQSGCGGQDDPCEIETGSYHVAHPDGPSGQTPTSALIFFHGWQQTGRLVIRNQALVEAVTSRGVMLIAPNGMNKTWAHGGSPSDARDEIAFVGALKADIIARFNVDPEHIYVSGFSQGGSMAWDVACYMGNEFAAFLPIAGAFWQPLPENCPTASTVRHIHGTSDTVVPMNGRPIGGGQWHQGDVMQSMYLLLSANACPVETVQEAETDTLSCETWSRCSARSVVELCLHNGGHNFRAEWVGDGLDWARERD